MAKKILDWLEKHNVKHNVFYFISRSQQQLFNFYSADLQLLDLQQSPCICRSCSGRGPFSWCWRISGSLAHPVSTFFSLPSWGFCWLKLFFSFSGDHLPDKQQNLECSHFRSYLHLPLHIVLQPPSSSFCGIKRILQSDQDVHTRKQV